MIRQIIFSTWSKEKYNLLFLMCREVIWAELLLLMLSAEPIQSHRSLQVTAVAQIWSQSTLTNASNSLRHKQWLLPVNLTHLSLWLLQFRILLAIPKQQLRLSLWETVHKSLPIRHSPEFPTFWDKLSILQSFGKMIYKPPLILIVIQISLFTFANRLRLLGIKL